MKANELMIGDLVKCGKRYMKVTQLAEDMDCDDIEPIPLTPEILEKNGIELSVGPGGLYQGTISGVNCHIEFNIIKYVHELQNALRLCGIEKEIEL